MTENLLPEFHELVRTAHDACEAEDLFDVHSEIPESLTQWRILQKEATEAKSKLITYVKENPELLTQILSLTQ